LVRALALALEPPLRKIRIAGCRSPVAGCS
jgi:hypothetical protein